MSQSSPVAPHRVISGKLIVLAMFAFGSILTGALWTYWYYHTAPFQPLQKAIALEFPKSAPRVDGGQYRMHLGTPHLLWVIMRVPFKPQAEPDRAKQTVDRVMELARENVTLGQYEELTVRLFYGEPEKVIHSQDFQFDLKAAVPAQK